MQIKYKAKATFLWFERYNWKVFVEGSALPSHRVTNVIMINNTKKRKRDGRKMKGKSLKIRFLSIFR